MSSSSNLPSLHSKGYVSGRHECLVTTQWLYLHKVAYKRTEESFFLWDNWLKKSCYNIIGLLHLLRKIQSRHKKNHFKMKISKRTCQNKGSPWVFMGHITFGTNYWITTTNTPMTTVIWLDGKCSRWGDILVVLSTDLIHNDRGQVCVPLSPRSVKPLYGFECTNLVSPLS